MQWHSISPLSDDQLSDFEQKFRFKIQTDLRLYLLEHNNGRKLPDPFPTTGRKYQFAYFLDFSGPETIGGAWEVNKRLRKRIGAKRIILAKDSSENWICLERDHKEQYIVVWSHITGNFERCQLDIPAFLGRLD